MAKDIIGRYELESEIGRGGMATVFLAYDPRFRRKVAIKLASINLQGNPSIRLRFEREARLIAAIEHPAIVPVYDFGEQNDQLYLVMRYMPGGTLTGKIRAGAMELSQVSRVMAQIAPALDAVHAQGIIHRDLKPGNILLDGFGNPAISDFGIAHLSETTSELTGSAVMGTPSYMSPEQINAKVDLDGRSDVYSLGVILFEMLTGRTPFKSPTPISLAMKHLSEPIPHIRALRPDLPPEIDRIMESAMAKDRELRYASATELSGALQALQNISPESESPRSGPLVIQPGQEAATEIDLPEPSGSFSRAAPDGSRIGTGKATAPAMIDSPQAVLMEKAVMPVSPAPASQPVPARKRPAWGLGWVAALAGLGLILTMLCVSLGALGLWTGSRLPLLTSPSASPGVSGTSEADVLFLDNFSDQASGWPSSQTSQGEYGYRSSGDYHILVRQQDAVLWVSTERQYDNSRIYVDAKTTEAGRDGYYGLLCRIQNAQNFYYFVIRTNGDYAIGKYKNGEFGSFFREGWRHADAVLTGTKTNRIEAECVGNSLRLTVNNTLLGEAQDSDFVSGESGLAAAALNADGFEVVFSQFMVTKTGQ